VRVEDCFLRGILDARVCVDLVVGDTLIIRSNRNDDRIKFTYSRTRLCLCNFFGLKNNRRADDKEIADRVARDTKINIKLDDISGDVKEIRYDITETKKQVAEMDKRLVIVEQATKSAHHRLDDITNSKKKEELDNA
jgi:hypothetical protein